MRIRPRAGHPPVSARQATAARHYARAALEIARAQGGSAPATTGEELRAVAALVSTEPAVRELMQPRGLTDEARRRQAGALAAAAKLTPLTARVLELMAARDHLALVPALAAEYEREWNKAQGIVTAEAVSAAPLEVRQASAIEEALARALGARVALKTRVDPAVLGGVLVSAGGRTYDGTVRGRLLALRRRLVASS